MKDHGESREQPAKKSEPRGGEVIKPGLDSGLEWNLESLHTRTSTI